MALAATTEALADARMPLVAGPRTWPLVLGGGASGMFEAEAFVGARLRSGPRVAGARFVLEVPHDSPSDRVAQAFGFVGPRVTVITACSSGSIAVGLAADMIAGGEATVALAGGADSLSRLTYAGFNSLRVVDAEPCRPFDLRRRGMSCGEGAAILVLEDAEHARRRGVTPYATVLGYGVTDDALHMTRPDPTGAAWERTIRAAIEDAGIAATDIDYVNAHGTATEQNDAAECAAFRRALGDAARRACRCPRSRARSGTACARPVRWRRRSPPSPWRARRRRRRPGSRCPTRPAPSTRSPGPAGRCRSGSRSSSSFAFGGNAAVLAFGRPA